MSASQDNSPSPVFAFCIGLVVGITIIGVIIDCTDDTRRDVQREAVKAGVAEWKADADGRPDFQWIKPRQAAPQEQPR